MIDYQKMAEINGLGWQVEMTNLQTIEGQETPFFGVRRKDTLELFHACRANYLPFQNADLFRLADSIAPERNLPIKNCMSIEGGRKVLLQLDSGVIHGVGKNKDTVEQYVTVVNSHDGSSSLRWGLSTQTLSCKNQFHRIGRSLNRTRHTKSLHVNLEASIKEIAKIQEEQLHLGDVIQELSKKDVTRKQIDSFLSELLYMDMSLPDDEICDNYHGRKTNKAFAIKHCVEQEMNYKGRNAWALWEGVTYYSTHVMGGPRKRQSSKILGSGAVLDQAAMNLALKTL